MIHFAHMVLFATLVSVFFAFLQAAEGRRALYAAKLWGLLVGSALLLGLLMAPLG